MARLRQPWDEVPHKRRYVPPAGALVMTLVASLPIWWGDFSAVQANRWSLVALILVFVFMGALFYTMRSRMTSSARHLTIFGQALVDYFSALVGLSGTMVVVWTTLLALSISLRPTPNWLGTLNRALIAGSGTLIVLTGAAVFYELKRAGGRPSVHVDDAEYDAHRHSKGQIQT